MPETSFSRKSGEAVRVPGRTYWRVEGSLFEMSALRSVGFFNWNSQSFLERWVRRSGMFAMTLLRPALYLSSRTFATRSLHSVLRGISRDRLDLLGEEYFQYELKPRMRREAVEKLVDAVRRGEPAFGPGSWCNFCPAGGLRKCLRLYQRAVEDAGRPPAQDWKPAELPVIDFSTPVSYTHLTLPTN